MRSIIITLVVGGLLGGCSFARRSEDMYLKDTRKVLQARDPDIKSCYDQALKADAKASGTVVVHFTVEADTGKIVSPEVTPESTAPAALGECVVKSLDGLVLEPGDVRSGDATFSWSFGV